MKNLQENLAKLAIFIRQLDNIHARAIYMCVDPRGYMTSGCSKNRKIVPYHRCARILRLTVTIPDYGSWDNLILSFNHGRPKQNCCDVTNFHQVATATSASFQSSLFYRPFRNSTGKWGEFQIVTNRSTDTTT